MAGERSGRPRLGDVAVASGVSTATVSLVLRGVAGPSAATAERVLAAADRLGYRPDRAASALASRRSRSIGVALDLRNPFHADLTLAIQDAALRQGHEVLLAITTAHQDENATAETLLDSRCAALILLGPRSPLPDLERVGRQVPVVALGRPLTSAVVDVVRSADDDGIAQAVRHLADLGHRDIAYLDGPPGEVADIRRTGYRRAMRDAGLSRWERVVPGGQTEDEGSTAAPELFRERVDPAARRRGETRPTAVVAFNDRSAVGLLAACSAAGFAVPADLSVVGFDDSALARLPQIALTTVAQDVRSLAEHAVAAAVRRASGDRDTVPEVVVRPDLVVRSTTGPLVR